MVWVPDRSPENTPSDVADAGPWLAGPAALSAQSGGQPTGWVFSLPPLPLSANLPSLPQLKLSSLSNRVEGKEKNKNREGRRKEEGKEKDGSETLCARGSEERKK
jgi:hypothetical protein